MGVDAGAHGLGRADENPLFAGVHVVEEALLGGGALVVLHEGNLGRGHAERDQLLPRPEIGGKAASLGDGRRSEVGEDHLRRAGDRVRRAVGAKVAAIGRLAPDFEDFGDHRIQFVLGLVRMAGINEAEVDRGVAAVGYDRKQDVVALLGFALALFDRLDALSQNLLIGLEGGARGNGDDLALAAGDLRELEILSKLRLQDDVGEVAEHRNEFGDVDELGEPADRLVEARGLQLEVRGRLAEGGGPGVEFLNAALGKHFGLEEPLDGEHLAERVGDRRAGGGDQRPHRGALRAEESGLDVEVPGALRPVRIDALQRALVGGEGELAELLHLIDDDLVDADLGDRQEIVFAGFQRLEPRLHALFHPLDAFARDAVLGVDPIEKIDVGADHVRDESPLEVGGRGDELERRMGDDDAVPIRRRGSGKEALTLVLHEIGLVGDEDVGGRVELQEFAGGLRKAVPGHGAGRAGIVRCDPSKRRGTRLLKRAL